MRQLCRLSETQFIPLNGMLKNVDIAMRRNEL